MTETNETPVEVQATEGAVETAEVTTKPQPITKDEFVEGYLQETISRLLGKKVSKAAAWNIFKGTIACGFEAASTGRPVSLAGVGKFEILISKRSEEKNQPAKRMRFRPSSAVNDTLNNGESFLAELKAKLPLPGKEVAEGTEVATETPKLVDTDNVLSSVEEHPQAATFEQPIPGEELL